MVSCFKRNHSFAKLSDSFEQFWIYHKDFDITEFIGEKLASIRGIRSVHYFPGCFGDKKQILQGGKNYKERCIRTCSFEFKKESSKYFSSLSLYNIPMAKGNHWKFLLNNCKDYENMDEFTNEVLELMALDIYMEQRDRNHNIMYEKSCDGELHLAPAFDYECSFYENEDYVGPYLYQNDLGDFCCEEDYWCFMEKYPQFREMLSAYLDVDLEKEIREMFDERGFSIKNFDLDFYKRCDERNHKRLEIILK